MHAQQKWIRMGMSDLEKERMRHIEGAYLCRVNVDDAMGMMRSGLRIASSTNPNINIVKKSIEHLRTGQYNNEDFLEEKELNQRKEKLKQEFENLDEKETYELKHRSTMRKLPRGVAYHSIRPRLNASRAEQILCRWYIYYEERGILEKIKLLRTIKISDAELEIMVDEGDIVYDEGGRDE